MWLFETAVEEGIEDFLILSGDHLYRCNYQDFVREHRETNSDITVAALPCDPVRASAFGLMKIDDEGRISSFAEKPTGDALKAMQVDTTILGLSPEKAAVRVPFSSSIWCQQTLLRLK
jgi:glucose-1-phosphate adenylyltransferase